jgi:glycosyltransferase involved in cell wall biosynthesis
MPLPNAHHPSTQSATGPLWTFAQLGAREHYAPARAAHEQGRLRALYTDLWMRHGRALTAYGPAPLRALAGRWHPGLPGTLIHTLGIGCAAQSLRARRPRDIYAQALEFVRQGEYFGSALRTRLERLEWRPDTDSFFGFTTTSLEAVQALSARGISSFVGQIDPAKAEHDIVDEERARWPGWEARTGDVPAAYWERLWAEWDASAGVIVNSQWSSQALRAQGVPAEKLFTVPLAFVPQHIGEVREPRRGPLRVLFLGQVNLRKGIPYLIEAARRLIDEDIVFTVAGPIDIDSSKVADAPVNMNFVGPIPRIDTVACYRDADVFVLPTVSDGFALTQLEAMAAGLPVVTTQRCGDVVDDGVDGRLIDACNAASLADALGQLSQNRDQVAMMSSAALAKSGQFGLGRVISGLDDAWRTVQARK